VSETFSPNVEPKIEVPQYSFSLQRTRFPEKIQLDIETVFGSKAAGKPHMDYIGKNKDGCRKRLGLGYTLQSLNINGQSLNLGLTEYSNHIWINQTNEVDGKPMKVCLDCGSLWINNKFVPKLWLIK
jgi:hypothetical protein